MRGESQVEIAFLILLTAAYYSDYEVNSELIGEAAGCSPVVVRRIYKKLKNAGLLDTKPGRYGLHLQKSPESISYLDVIQAVRPIDSENTFGVSAPLSGTSPVSHELFCALNTDLSAATDALKASLSSKTLEDLASQINVHSDLPHDAQKKLIRSYMDDAEKRYAK